MKLKPKVMPTLLQYKLLKGIVMRYLSMINGISQVQVNSYLKQTRSHNYAVYDYDVKIKNKYFNRSF